MAAFETLVEKFKVVERRDGEIYRTASLGEVWVPAGTPLYVCGADDTMYCSLSTKRLVALNYRTMRRAR